MKIKRALQLHRRRDQFNLPPSGLGGLNNGDNARPVQKERRDRKKLEKAGREAMLMPSRIVKDQCLNMDNALKRVYS